MVIMKRLLFTGIITLSMFLSSFQGAVSQKVGLYQCKWHPELTMNNGEDLIDQMQLHEKSQFLFMLSNDEKNLFIDLIMFDKAAIQKTMRFGLTTWLNPEAKQKKGMGISFPVAPEGSGEPSFKRDKGGDKKEMMQAMMAMKNQEMVLIGFGEKNEQITIDPRVDTAFDGNVEMLEGGMLKVSLVLPLEKLGRSGENAGNPFSVGFETGYLDVTGQAMPSGDGMAGGGGGMHGGGGGMPGGGPPQGGVSGDMQTGNVDQQKQPEISELASPSKMWIKQVTLAKKP